MQNIRIALIQRFAIFPLLSSSILVSACVSKETHLETVVELEQSRRQVVESDLKGKVLQGQLDQAQNNIKTQKQEMDALKTKLRESSGRVTVLEKDLATAKQTVAGGTNQIASLTKERDELKGNVAREHDAAEKLKAELSALTATHQDLQSKQQELQQALQAAQQEAANHKRALDEGKTRSVTIDKEKQQLVEALQDTRARLRELDSKLAAETQARQALEEQVGTARTASQRTAQKEAELRQQLDALKTTHEQEQRQMKESGSQVTDLTSQLAQEKTRADALANEMSAREKEVESLRTAVTEREKEVESLRSAVADREALSARVATLNEELDQANRRIATLDQMMNKALFGQ